MFNVLCIISANSQQLYMILHLRKFLLQSTFPMWNTFNLKGSMKKTVDNKALDLLEQMLVYDPRS